MNKVKFLLIILSAFLLLSCGKQDENESENAGDENGETTEQQTTESKEQPAGESDDTLKEQPKSKTDTGKSSEELRFYSNAKPEAVISPLQASDYIGRVVTVKGFVAEVHRVEKVEYLNFVERFPENPFSGVIFASRFKDFGDITIYEGKNVELTGRVTVYKGKPQIIMDGKEQIKILN
jgi:DNA/RNA endonuclease YhcR with UshA esterase domain